MKIVFATLLCSIILSAKAQTFKIHQVFLIHHLMVLAIP